MRSFSFISRLTIAALLISGAAICAYGQSRANSKQNTRATTVPTEPDQPEQTEKRSASPADVKHNTREKTTERATETAPASSSTGLKIRFSYEFTQPEFFIRHIVVQHNEQGRGQITFKRKDNDEPIVDPIELSPAALSRIKALWDALRFLDSTANYQSEKQFAHLGTMRLSMESGERSRVAEFNWTQDKDAFALVNEYRRVADQAIFVFDVSVARENQPLETPKLMSQLDRMYKRNGLSDAQQLLPLLREISTDERLPLIARNHAGRLIKQIQK